LTIINPIILYNKEDFRCFGWNTSSRFFTNFSLITLLLMTKTAFYTIVSTTKNWQISTNNKTHPTNCNSSKDLGILFLNLIKHLSMENKYYKQNDGEYISLIICKLLFIKTYNYIILKLFYF